MEQEKTDKIGETMKPTTIITTMTALRLNEIKESLINNYGLEHTDEYKMYGERNAIIDFKNELKDKREHIYDKYMVNCKCEFCKWIDNLIGEIESVEKQ